MFFSPHILQKEVITEPQRDEFGRIIPGTGGPSWIDLCPCRCDDNTTKYFTSDNGSVYKPLYKIICDGIVNIQAGENVRALNMDLSIRGQGEVYIVTKTNYFENSTVWV